MDKVFCKTTSKGIQSFYLTAENKDYFLFSQEYRVSVKEHFKCGLSINECLNYSLTKSCAVRRTLDKLKVYIPYIEKEYGIAVFNKTKNKNGRNNRSIYSWKDDDYYSEYYCCEVAE